jgi:hypothetical protein
MKLVPIAEPDFSSKAIFVYISLETEKGFRKMRKLKSLPWYRNTVLFQQLPEMTCDRHDLHGKVTSSFCCFCSRSFFRCPWCLYAQPLSGVSGRPFDVAAVEERMKLMRQSYLDQVRAIAGAQAKAFTITAPNSMSARRMSQLAAGWPTSFHERFSSDILALAFLLEYFVMSRHLQCINLPPFHACPAFRIIYCAAL